MDHHTAGDINRRKRARLSLIPGHATVRTSSLACLTLMAAGPGAADAALLQDGAAAALVPAAALPLDLCMIRGCGEHAIFSAEGKLLLCGELNGASVAVLGQLVATAHHHALLVGVLRDLRDSAAADISELDGCSVQADAAALGRNALAVLAERAALAVRSAQQ